MLQEPPEERMSLVGSVLGHGLGQPVRYCWGQPLGLHPLLHGAPKGAASHQALGRDQPLCWSKGSHALLNSQAELCSGVAPATLVYKGLWSIFEVKTSVWGETRCPLTVTHCTEATPHP